MTFFRDSMIETYRKMWRNMDSKKNPSAFTSTYEEGIRRVNSGNYAFLMESTMLDYIVNRNCNLTQIGGLLDSKSYGIATPKGSRYRDQISLAILELQEKGDIQMLYDKWWKNDGETCTRKSNNKQAKANALGLDNIGGVFVVLMVGIAIAVCVAIFEFWNYHRTMRVTLLLADNHSSGGEDSGGGVATKNVLVEDFRYTASSRRSLWVEMAEEFRYAWHCTDPRRRPVLRKRVDSNHALHSFSQCKNQQKPETEIPEEAFHHQEELNVNRAG